MRRHLTFANVISALALVIALGTGTAYAANTVFSTDIVDGEVKNPDIHNSAVTSGKLHNSQVKAEDLDADAVDGSKVLDGSLTGSDVANSSLTGSDIAPGTLSSSDIADHAILTSDLNGTDHHGAISVGSLSNGRCATITGSVGGARPGDAAVLTTDGSIPSGMLIYAQRALTDQVQIKVCNLSGATSAPINDLPVRLITIH